MKTYPALLGVSVVFTLFWGCSLTPYPPSRPRVPAPTVEEVRLANRGVRSLRALGKVELHYQGKRAVAREAIALVRPGSLRLETLDSLNRPVLILATNGSSFQAMSLSENRFYRGGVSEGLGYFLHVRISSEALVSLLLGDIPPEGAVSMGYDSGKGLYRLAFPPSTEWMTQNYWIHPKTLKVLEMSKTILEGEEIRVVFNGFKKTGSVQFPREIALEVPGARNRIRLDLHTIEINPSLPPDLFALSPPIGAEVLEINGPSGTLIQDAEARE